MDIEGYVTVFESSDGGSGQAADTFWQFFIGGQPENFIDGQPVTTRNPLLAETIRLAVNTSSKVRVTFDPNRGNVMSQARIAFKYVCNSRKIERCVPTIPEDPTKICETIRFAPCEAS